MRHESHIEELGVPPKPGPSVPYFADPLNHMVVHSPDPEIYLGSPSLARAPEGSLVISHDFFGTIFLSGESLPACSCTPCTKSGLKP